ncbi:ABC transporter ATP-binding protein [Bradyrhizobium elkanii]|uniref:ABC transporter ATP-binding protein n=1 Tax=Bradyrhizobium elkanii TaxID=29448 RepID=UPI0004BA06B2|nr:ABC transporter ATP-binding protein [Bradyrhizobium elkanii]WLA85827.1 ABC transporter ATP-binding protein [Bradyrhizobium elkanii]
MEQTKIGGSAAVRVSGLGKTYRVWRRPSDMLLEALTFGRRHSEFQALADISFELPPGSVTGIMGRNGAGKSTLLRIVAGTLDATAGSVEVKGRIAAILELGTGFSPDYTARENIFLGGMCLGLKYSDIRKRFDEIVAFAEVGDFIDQPFRTFSSGMQARLTFAVATCVDPNILIIDEALAVGDARFQVKSFDRVREFKRRGKAILLVSHDTNQIATICDRALLLEKGRIIADGPPQKVSNIYHEMLFGTPQAVLAPRDQISTIPVAERSQLGERTEQAEIKELDDGSVPRLPPTNGSALDTSSAASRDSTPTAASSIDEPALVPARAELHPQEHRYGDGAAIIEAIAVTDENGQPVNRMQSLGIYNLVCWVKAKVDVGPLIFGWLVRDKRGLDLFGWDMQTAKCEPVPPMRANDRFKVVVRFQANLGAGSFFITAALADTNKHKHDVRYEALEMLIEGSPEIYETSLINLMPKLLKVSAAVDETP